MRWLLAILLCLPLVAQIAVEPVVEKDPIVVEPVVVKVYPVPVDWSTVKRPLLTVAVTALKAERTAGECQGCLHMGAPAVYAEGKVIWYVVHHERIGTLAVQDKALLTEIGRCPKFEDGPHDEKWITEYLAGEIKAGTVRQWRETPAVYDGEKLITPAVGIIPEGWTVANTEAVAPTK